MIQTEERSLQSVLKERYSIDEPLLAEGRFVCLIGDHATHLVCLGISTKSLVIALVDLEGDTLDYELLSVTPLSVLSMYYQWETQKVTVARQYKSSLVFQFCSCANQTNEWANFVSAIRDMFQYDRVDGKMVCWSSAGSQFDRGDGWSSAGTLFDRGDGWSSAGTLFDRGDGWSSAALKPAYVSVPIQTEFESMNGRILDQYSRISTRNAPIITECFNVEFDSFVNDVKTPFLKEDNMNMSNNNDLPDLFDCMNTGRRRSESKIMKFFRKYVPCWK